MSLRHTNPDPEALAIALEMQERLQPAEVILLGSRAAGDHRPDSDADLMAVVPDENGKLEADGILRDLLEGKYEDPVVTVFTITRERFRRTVPMAQSQAGQAARHGVTPDGKSLDYRPEGEPKPQEILQATIYWLTMAENEADGFVRLLEYGCFPGLRTPAQQGQWALGRAFKGLLTAGNDEARFRKDAALMWRHFESTRPLSDRNGAKAMEELLRGTAGPDGQGCRLTEFSEAFRRGGVMPTLTGPEQEAVRRHLAPAVNMLIEEALARAGGTREDMERQNTAPCRERRGGSGERGTRTRGRAEDPALWLGHVRLAYPHPGYEPTVPGQDRGRSRRLPRPRASKA